MSAAPPMSDALDEYWLTDVLVVPARDGIGRFPPSWLISKLPVLTSVFSEIDMKVSALFIAGIAGRSSSFKTGNDGFKVIGLFSPVFFAALTSAFLLLRSSSTRALLILSATISLSRLLTLRSQNPVKPPSARGM